MNQIPLRECGQRSSRADKKKSSQATSGSPAVMVGVCQQNGGETFQVSSESPGENCELLRFLIGQTFAVPRKGKKKLTSKKLGGLGTVWRKHKRGEEFDGVCRH